MHNAVPGKAAVQVGYGRDTTVVPYGRGEVLKLCAVSSRTASSRLVHDLHILTALLATADAQLAACLVKVLGYGTFGVRCPSLHASFFFSACVGRSVRDRFVTFCPAAVLCTPLSRVRCRVPRTSLLQLAAQVPDTAHGTQRSPPDLSVAAQAVNVLHLSRAPGATPSASACVASAAAVWAAFELLWRANYVHGDIKANNLLIDGEGAAATVTLIDFGLAADLAPLPQAERQALLAQDHQQLVAMCGPRPAKHSSATAARQHNPLAPSVAAV